MKIEIAKRFFVVLLSTFVFTNIASCSADYIDDDEEVYDSSDEDFSTDDDDYDEIAQKVFDAWMELNHPDIVDNRQSEGYYIEVLSEDKDTSYPATNKTSCWVEYNITSRDLDGNVCNTRNESMALQQGTFNLYTRYAPTKRYISLTEDEDYDDAVTYAFRTQELVIDGVSMPLDLTVGSKIRLWIPSSLTGVYANGSSGYSGQYSLSSGRPMVSEIEITRVVVDAERDEREVLDWFIESQETPSDWKFVINDYSDYIFINYDYIPSTQINYLDPYNYTQLNNAADLYDLNDLIAEKTLDVFGEGDKPDWDDNDDLVGENYCNFWYITRTLDGFVVDSNIPEVVSAIRNTWEYNTEDHGTPLYYSMDGYGDSYISAFYYTIPKLIYGQWATMVTTSLEAYDIDGVSASTSSTEIQPYTTLIFHIFVEGR